MCLSKSEQRKVETRAVVSGFEFKNEAKEVTQV